MTIYLIRSFSNLLLIHNITLLIILVYETENFFVSNIKISILVKLFKKNLDQQIEIKDIANSLSSDDKELNDHFKWLKSSGSISKNTSLDFISKQSVGTSSIASISSIDIYQKLNWQLEKSESNSEIMIKEVIDESVPIVISNKDSFLNKQPSKKKTHK